MKPTQNKLSHAKSMWRRWLAGLLGAFNALNGVMMLADGKHWYDTVPGVVFTGPYNPHFVQDIGVAFLVGAIARSFVATAAALTVLMMTALLLKTIASMALFIPGNPALWLTPGSVIGLVAGVMLWLPLSSS